MEDRNLERQLLNYIKFSPKLIFERTDENCFSVVEFARVYNVFASYFFTFGGIPKDSTLHAHFTDQKQLTIARKIIEYPTDDMDLAELEFIINRLEELSITRILRPMVLDTVDEMGQGHGYEALEILQQGLIEIQRSQRRIIREGDEIEGDIKTSLFMRENDLVSDKEDERTFNLGFPGFDEYSGGVREGQLINFVAPTGHGKSITLMNIGGNMYNAGLNVVYVLLEMDRREWEFRFDSWLTGIRFRKLYTGNLDKTEWVQYRYAQIISLLQIGENASFIEWLKREGIRELHRKTIKKFVHEHMGDCTFRKNIFYPLDIPRNCTIEVLETRVNYIRQKYGCDVLIIDYPGIMSYSKGADTGWRDLEQLFKELKEIARFYRIPVIVAAQAHDEDLGPNRRMNASIIRFSKALLDHCDLCLGWITTLQDMRKKRIIMKPLKVRNMGSNFEIEFDAQFDIMKITEAEFKEFD